MWDVVEGFIEPLAVLRSTVEQWRRIHCHSSWHCMVSENILLLLDPAVLADSKQEKRANAAFAPLRLPQWPDPGKLAFAQTGCRRSWDIASPPPVCLPPSGFCSTTVRLATAYATWLEAAADVLAQCVSLASAQPVSVTCEGLGPALGPARAWLTACGFTFHAHGMSS